MSTSDRLLSVLGLFSVEQPLWNVEEAAAALGLAVSTAYRYFRSLSEADLITSFTNGRYVLGPAIIKYDRQLRLLDPLISVSAPIMQRLAPILPPDCLLLLCRLYRDQVMCVHQEYAKMPNFAVSYERGRPMPLSRGAASKVILANLPARFLKGFHARHADEMRERIGADWPQVRARLREIRSQGVHVTQSELDPGMMGVAAPLFEPAGAVVGSVSVVLPARHGTPDVVERAATLMRVAGAEISTSLAGLADRSQPAATGADGAQA
jgi:DNA-binding IclR family transcriptional regulator